MHTPHFTVIATPRANVGKKRDQRTVERKLREIGFQCFDTKVENVGKLKNKPVLLDYGFGLETCKRH